MCSVKDKPPEKSVKSGQRRARLGQALRANLLKRKAQAKAKNARPRKSDEGRQD